jgi:hypothetical protein
LHLGQRLAAAGRSLDGCSAALGAHGRGVSDQIVPAARARPGLVAAVTAPEPERRSCSKKEWNPERNQELAAVPPPPGPPRRPDDSILNSGDSPRRRAPTKPSFLSDSRKPPGQCQRAPVRPDCPIARAARVPNALGTPHARQPLEPDRDRRHRPRPLRPSPPAPGHGFAPHSGHTPVVLPVRS